MKARLIVSTATAALLALVACTPADSEVAAPPSLPSTSSLPDRSLPARWWEWVEQFPSDANPVSDTTGADCAAHQPTDGIWFLAGTFGGSAERSCEVPAGAQIYFPVLNQICEVEEGQSEDAALERCTVLADSKYARLDGKSLPVKAEDSGGAFTFETVSGTVGLGPGSWDAVASGLWVGPVTLAPGSHRLTFGGRAGSFELEVTYDLRVR